MAATETAAMSRAANGGVNSAAATTMRGATRVSTIRVHLVEAGAELTLATLMRRAAEAGVELDDIGSLRSAVRRVRPSCRGPG